MRVSPAFSTGANAMHVYANYGRGYFSKKAYAVGLGIVSLFALAAVVFLFAVMGQGYNNIQKTDAGFDTACVQDSIGIFEEDKAGMTDAAKDLYMATGIQVYIHTQAQTDATDTDRERTAATNEIFMNLPDPDHSIVICAFCSEAGTEWGVIPGALVEANLPNRASGLVGEIYTATYASKSADPEDAFSPIFRETAETVQKGSTTSHGAAIFTLIAVIFALAIGGIVSERYKNAQNLAWLSSRTDIPGGVRFHEALYTARKAFAQNGYKTITKIFNSESTWILFADLKSIRHIKTVGICVDKRSGVGEPFNAGSEDAVKSLGKMQSVDTRISVR